MACILLRAGNFHDSLDHLMKKPCLRGIGRPIVDLFSFPARDNEPARFQRPQMVRDGGARHVHHRRNVDHARLTVTQQPENPHARRVAQLAEHIRDDLKFIGLLQFPAQRRKLRFFAVMVRQVQVFHGTSSVFARLEKLFAPLEGSLRGGLTSPDSCIILRP